MPAIPAQLSAGSMLRDPAIDALRGVSILLEVWRHLALGIRLSDTVLGERVPCRLPAALGFNGYETMCVP